MWKNIISYIEKKSTSKFSQYFLGLIAFVESIFFPIPPDIVLVPIIYFNKNKFLKTVINCTFFSVLGGAVGYLIGFYLFDLVKNFLDLEKQKMFFNFYDDWGLIAIFLGGFTPIPYKVIAITSGYAKFNFFSFILLSVLSRGMRFIIIGYIVKKYGDLGISFLEKNKYLIFFIVPILAIGLIYMVSKHA